MVSIPREHIHTGARVVTQLAVKSILTIPCVLSTQLHWTVARLRNRLYDLPLVNSALSISRLVPLKTIFSFSAADFGRYDLVDGILLARPMPNSGHDAAVSYSTAVFHENKRREIQLFVV